jgi:hypothetical protein
MIETKIKIGIIDSGASEEQSKYMMQGQRFSQNTQGEIIISAPLPDRLGHGQKVLAIIQSHKVHADYFNAQVFNISRNNSGVTTAKIVAAAIDWLRSKNVDIIHLSLGLREDRQILKRACEKALAHNIIMVASSPAQGKVPYPAAYNGIIRATGDARCTKDEFSFLNSSQADFGGCPYGPDDHYGAGGASFGAAHITGHIAKILSNGCAGMLKDTLSNQAAYHGKERRSKERQGR